MAYPYYNNNQFYMQDLQNMREKIAQKEKENMSYIKSLVEK